MMNSPIRISQGVGILLISIALWAPQALADEPAEVDARGAIAQAQLAANQQADATAAPSGTDVATEDDDAVDAVAETIDDQTDDQEVAAAPEPDPGDGHPTEDDSSQGEPIDRLQAFFDSFGDGEVDLEDAPSALMRLRQVGHRLTEGGSSYLHLQPYVVDPRWDEAMELLLDDECTEALKLATDLLGPASLHADGEPAIAYAFARMQACSADSRARTQGRQTLAGLAELDSTVGHLARRALGRTSNPAVDDESQSINGHIQHARSLASGGDVDAALAHLRAFRADLDGGWNRHQVRFAEAEILEEAGRDDEAAMAYLGIYRKTRSWRSSDQIARRIDDAEERMDREIVPFGDRVDRMRELIARGRYQHARQVSQQNARIRGVSGSELTGWTRYRQGLQNERQRNRQRAVSQFEEAERLIEDPDVRPRMYFGWARALRRTDGDTEAIALYERLCEEYPSHHLCPQSLYEAGRLHQYRNRHDEARARFADLVGLHPFSEHVPDALWRYSLSAYLEGDYDAAIPPLMTIVANYGEIQDASELTIGLKARYWIGVNHLKAERHEPAQRWLQQTVDHGPLTWYGGLAITRLKEADMRVRVRRPTTQLDLAAIEDFASLRIAENPRLELAAELTRLGLYSEALAEVRRHESVHPRPEGLTSFRAGLHLAVDQPNWAHWIMKSVIEESGPTHRTLRDWGFAFPLHYFDLSHRFGEEYGVSPHLVQAIMRQESGFRPTVRSHAGAMGLMKLMPGTARYTARTFFETRSITNNQILDEETNVRLGTMYIRIHHAHAADQTALALAGYNAGPGAMRSWYERYGDREVDAWVESITYRETRGYVRKVFTSYLTYHGLYDDSPMPTIPLQLPESLGEWGKVPEAQEIEEGEPVSMLFP